MPLNPIDVQQQTFKLSLRGYAEDEVDEFLDDVVISLRDYEQRLRDAQERVAVLEEQASANRETEDAMRRTFLAAQRTADTIIDEAKVESERLLAEARAEVDQVSSQQSEEKARLLAETSVLRERVSGLRAALTELAGATLSQLDDLGVESKVADLTGALDEVDEMATSGFEPLPAPSEEPDFADLDPSDTDLGSDSQDDVEIAKVPDWMTRDKEESFEGGEAEHPENSEEANRYRRPWERDDG